MRHSQVPSEKADREMRLPAMWCEDEGANRKDQLCGTPGVLLWKIAFGAFKEHCQKDGEVIARSQAEAPGTTKGLLK